MAKGTVSYCSKIAAAHQMEEEIQNFTVESILDSIHYMYVRNHVELVAAIESLQHFIVQHPKVSFFQLNRSFH